MPPHDYQRREPPPWNTPLDPCLRFLSRRWVTMIIWSLDQGPRRFGDLKRDLDGVSPKVLTERLKELEAHRLILRRSLEGRPPQVEYSLTPLGRELVKMLGALASAAGRLCEMARAQGVPCAEERA